MSSTNNALKPFLQHETPKILQALEVFFDEQLEKAEGKDAVLVDMVAVLKEFMLRGGKRVRPLLTILAYLIAKNLGHESGDIYRAAAAVETHHHYLLSIDDIADRDILRHGGKTLHEYYRTEVFQDWADSTHHGHSFSMIAGSLLNSFTFELLRTSQFPAERILKAEGIVNEMLFADTSLGWQIQYFQNNEPVASATEERFLKGLEFVTSRYTFVGPMLIGLHLALDESDGQFRQFKDLFTDYGKHVGIAFQIQDDVLGLFGDPKETGKAVGNDVREGKKTLLMQYAFQHSDAHQKKVIEGALNTPLTETQLKEVQQVVQETGSLAYSQDMAKEHVEKGIQVLETASMQTKEIQVLKELAEYMIARAH